MSATTFNTELKIRKDNDLKITKEKTHDAAKSPFLFALERGGKVSYLLGTCHIEPLESLPKVCHDIFDQSTFYVSEEIDYTDEELCEFYLKSVVRSETSKPWVDLLPSHVVPFLEERIAVYYAQHDESFHKSIHELKIWAAYQFAEDGHIILESRKQNADSKEIAEGETLIGMDNAIGMDHALIQRFGAKNGGLESKFDKIHGYKIIGSTIEDLIRLYTEMTSEPVEDLENTDETISGIIENY